MIVIETETCTEELTASINCRLAALAQTVMKELALRGRRRPRDIAGKPAKTRRPRQDRAVASNVYLPK